MTSLIEILKPESALAVAEMLHGLAAPVAFNHADALHLETPRLLSLEKLNQVRKYRVPDLTITVEAGMTFGVFQRLLAEQNQAFALTYAPETTLLEIFAEDRPAPETDMAGYPRDYLLGVEIATPDGQLTKAGGEVVKNVTGYDLNKLYAGAFNSLGVLTAVTVKLVGKQNTSRQDIKTQALAEVFKASFLLEMVCPVGAWSLLGPQVLELPNVVTLPDAGLGYLDLSDMINPEQSVTVLAEILESFGGFVRLLRVPKASMALQAKYALPADPVTRALHRRLENLYDPTGVLYAPAVMPFEQVANG